MDTVSQPFASGPALAPPADLAPYAGPMRVPLTGRLAAVRFPDLCAACAAPARGATLAVEKLFRRTSRRGSSHRFEHVHVPFCDGCRARHAAELPPVDPAVLRKLRWQFVGRVLPFVIPLAVLGYMIPMILLPMAASFLEGGVLTADGAFNWGLAIAAGVLGFFGFCLLAFLSLVNRARYNLVAGSWEDPNATHVRRERLLFGRNAVLAGPPTPTLAAVDFTDDGAELFEPERHTFTFRDAAFAEQVRSLNADRVWSGRSPRARWARRARTTLFALVLALATLSLVDEWTGGALVRVVREFLPW